MKGKKAWFKLAVEDVDAMRFRVESESGGSPHFVDMLDNDGKGRCDCKDFECRIAPVYAGKKQPPANNNLWLDCCKHQLRCKIHISEMLIGKILKQGKQYKGP